MLFGYCVINTSKIGICSPNPVNRKVFMLLNVKVHLNFSLSVEFCIVYRQTRKWPKTTYVQNKTANVRSFFNVYKIFGAKIHTMIKWMYTRNPSPSVNSARPPGESRSQKVKFIHLFVKMNESRSPCLVCKNFPLRLGTDIIIRQYSGSTKERAIIGMIALLGPPCVGRIAKVHMQEDYYHSNPTANFDKEQRRIILKRCCCNSTAYQKP